MVVRERGKKIVEKKGRKEKVNKIELLRYDIFIHALLVKQTLTFSFILLFFFFSLPLVIAAGLLCSPCMRFWIIKLM